MFASQIKLTPPSKAKGNASRKNIDTMIPKINSAGKDARRVAYGTKTQTLLSTLSVIFFRYSRLNPPVHNKPPKQQPLPHPQLPRHNHPSPSHTAPFSATIFFHCEFHCNKFTAFPCKPPFRQVRTPNKIENPLYI